MRTWIDSATYEQLLRKWRFEPVGSIWFDGEIGAYFIDAMARARKNTPSDEQVAASKSIGWKDE